MVAPHNMHYRHYKHYNEPLLYAHAHCISMGAQEGTIERAVEDAIRSCPVADREAMISSLRSILDSELMKTNFEAPGCACACSKCGSTDCIRYGRSKLGSQRWMCKSCGRVRNESATGSVLSRTKLDDDVWMRYAECFVDGLSDRKVAERLGVTNRTAWFMRIRALEALHDNLPSFQVKAGCGAEIDEIYFRESFKGTRFDRMENMPRAPRTGDELNVKQGISDDQICVVTAVNDAGDFFFDVACRGALTCDIASDALNGHVLSGAIVNTDKHRAYRRALEDLSVAAHIATGAKEHRNLERIDEIHGSIRTFMAPFRGVSTRWLHLYLAWYKWLREFSESVKVAAKQIASGDYQHTWRKIQAMGSPFRTEDMEPTKLPA